MRAGTAWPGRCCVRQWTQGRRSVWRSLPLPLPCRLQAGWTPGHSPCPELARELAGTGVAQGWESFLGTHGVSATPHRGFSRRCGDPCPHSPVGHPDVLHHLSTCGCPVPITEPMSFLQGFAVRPVCGRPDQQRPLDQQAPGPSAGASVEWFPWRWHPPAPGCVSAMGGLGHAGRSSRLDSGACGSNARTSPWGPCPSPSPQAQVLMF